MGNMKDKNKFSLTKSEWLGLIQSYKNEISNDLRHANNRYFEFLLLLIGLLIFMAFAFNFDIFFFFVGLSMVLVPIGFLAKIQFGKYYTFIFKFVLVSAGWIIIVSGCLFLCSPTLISISKLSNLPLFSISTFVCLILISLLLGHTKIYLWHMRIQISLEEILRDILLEKCDNGQIGRRFLVVYNEIFLARKKLIDSINQLKGIARKK